MSFKKFPKNAPQEKPPSSERSARVRAENVRLKGRLLQDELAHKSKELKKTRAAGGSRGPKNSNVLVQGLKKRVAILQKENKTLKEGLDALKKSLKMTTAQELNEEIKAYKDECARLRTIIDKGGNDKSHQEVKEEKKGKNKSSEKHNKVVEELKAENKELNKKLQKALKDAESKKSEAEEKKSSIEAANKKLAKEVKELKDQIESMKKADNSKAQAEELQRAKDKLAKQEDYERKIKALEKELGEYKRERKSPPKEQPKEDQKKVERLVDIVGKEEVKLPSVQLRLNLILADVAPEDVRKSVFSGSGGDKKVSIKELANALENDPASLEQEDAVKIARYLIEPRISKQVPQNEMLDKKVSAIEEGLLSLIGNYTLNCKNNPEAVQESLLGKINEKLEPFADRLQNAADSNGNLSLSGLEKIFADMNFDLTQDEHDYILLTMYRENKNLREMQYEAFVQHLGELLSKLLENADEEGESGDAPSADKEKSPSKESPSDSKKEKSPEQKSDEEMENLSENEILSLVQNCFTRIAEKVAEKQIDLEKLLKDKVYRKRVGGEEVELISPEDFMKAMKKIGVDEFKPVEKAYLQKMLAASEKENGFRIKDIIQILKDNWTGGNENNEEREMEIGDLDKVSLVLLLALSEYLSNTNTSLQKLFENVMYKQPVQIDDEELEIDIINSHDFFEIMNNIGIETEESQHENLKLFLCIDPGYVDKFSVQKLSMVLDEFKTNEELREHAREYYQEFIEEDDQMDNEGEEA